MPDLVQEKLHAILVDHGRRVMDDPPRLEALLRDYCGERRGEVSALLSALREGVPDSLASGPTAVPREALMATLARRLHENQGLTDDLARWAVDTWAFGLGLGESRHQIDTPMMVETPPRATPVAAAPEAVPPAGREGTHQQAEVGPPAPSRVLGWTPRAKLAALGLAAAVLLGLLARVATAPRRGETPATASASAAAAPTEPEPEFKVSGIELGRAVGSDNRVVAPATTFKPSDTVYVSVATEGSAPLGSKTVTAQWRVEGGKVLTDSGRITGPTVITFAVYDLQPGKHQVEITLDGAPAGSRDFEVKAGRFRVSAIKLGRQVGPDQRVTVPATIFDRMDTIHLAVTTEGSGGSSKTLTVEWSFENGEVDKDTLGARPPGRITTAPFIWNPLGLPLGKAKVEVAVNGIPVGSRDFYVK